MNRNERFIPRFVRRPGLATLLILPLVLVVASCSSDEPYVDFIPPSIPAGVSSITGDGAVYVRWIPNKENDLAGYRVWWDGVGDEEFEELAKIAPFEDGVYQDNGTATAADDFLEFEDLLGFDFNGTYNSYAISAYDFNGNESGLSWEFVVDVPRPEGYDLRVENRTEFPQFSGYDLSSLSSQPQIWNDISTDFWFDFDSGGFARLSVPRNSVRILDAGFQSYNGFGGLDGVDFAPANGWSAEGVVEAIAGHTYVLRIRNGAAFGNSDFYAKVWVEGFDRGAVLLWWAYQEVPGERQFSQPSPEGRQPREFVSGQEVQR